MRCGRLERLAIERHVRDLAEANKRGWYFDVEAAELAIDFCKYIRHSKGKWGGQVFEPEPWEVFILWCLFGWKRKDGLRRFRKAYVSMGRRNGKTFLAAVIGLIMLVADGESGAEIYTAATKRDQARIMHQAAVSMVRRSPDLRAKISIFKDNLSIDVTESKYEPLGADSGTHDGLNVSCALVDEIHAHKTSGMWDVLDSATGSREQPLLLGITTAGDNVVGVCRDLDDYGINLLEERFRDDAWFIFICRLDKGDDPFDRRVWRKANPNLGVSVFEDDLRIAARKAKRTPSARATFYIKRMNLWIGAKDGWLNPESWNACAGTIDVEALKGRACCGGLDLAKTRDMTAFVLAFPMDGGTVALVPHFFIPEGDDLDAYERSAGLPKGTYRDWERRGLLTITPGFSCDYAYVEEVIRNAAATHDLRDVAFDVYNARDIADRLTEHGITMLEFSQHITNMNSPCREFERLMLDRFLVHGDNPILNWHAGNVTVTAHNDLIRPIKSGGPDGKIRGVARNKIDGIVASIMAVARAQEIDTDGCIYDVRGPLAV